MTDIDVSRAAVERLLTGVTQAQEHAARQWEQDAPFNADEAYRIQVDARDVAALLARAEAAEVRAERLEAALRKLHHAVCGETGFAACVRLDSGKAYPWPALDEADAAARAALTQKDRTDV